MKKYFKKRVIINRVIKFNKPKSLNKNEPIIIIEQCLIYRVFRAKKRFKNKYDSKARKFYINGEIYPQILIKT